MKSDQPTSAGAPDSARPVLPEKAEKAERAKPADLGIVERRRAIRPLPVADVVESDRDTDWAAFQDVRNDQPESK
jgi:hypothetical protein